MDSYETHAILNQDIWDGDRLRPEVHDKLLEIAAKFNEFVDVGQDPVDIHFTGSMANFNYTSMSDIDLHLIYDYSGIDTSCEGLVADLMKAKKALWNDAHELNIKGYPVEVYAQDSDEPHISSGLYSVAADEWLVEPSYEDPHVDSVEVDKKAEHYKYMIEEAINSSNYATMDKLQKKIRDMRKAGLEAAGEYSVENLVFKELRNSGYIGDLIKKKREIFDKGLSLGRKIASVDPIAKIKVYQGGQKTSYPMSFSSSRDFAEDYGSVREFYIEISNPFDTANKEMVSTLIEQTGVLFDSYDEEEYTSFEEYEDSPIYGLDTWELFERYIEAIKGLGYNGMIIYEGGLKNYVVFDSSQVQEVKVASEKEPTVFLGGECQTDWRDAVIDAHIGLDLIDPVDPDWKPEENIYEEVADMLTSDAVVFKEGGEGTEHEKELLDTLDIPYEEFDSVEEVNEFLDDLEAGELSKEAVKEAAVIKTALDYEYGCIMAPVPDELKMHILKEVAPDIPKDDLNVDESNMLFGIETDTHVTVLYGIESTDAAFKQVVDYVNDTFDKPLTIKSEGKIEYFDNDDASVAVIKVDSPELHTVHDALKAAMRNKDTYDEYVPHITIAYLQPGVRLEQDSVQPFEWTISRLDISKKDGDKKPVYLGNADDSVKLVASVKVAYDYADDYADALPSQIFYDNRDKFFGNLGDNEDYNDYTNWRGNFFGLPHVRKRLVDMMDANNINRDTSNTSIRNKSEEGDHRADGDINDGRPSKSINDFVTKTIVDETP